MKTKYHKAVRAFYRISSSPASQQAPTIMTHLDQEEVFFGLYYPDGRVPEGVGELSMSWYRHNAEDASTPRLEVTCSALRLLWKLRSVINATWRRSSAITPDEFCELLTRLGFRDLTETLLPPSQSQIVAATHLASGSEAVSPPGIKDAASM